MKFTIDRKTWLRGKGADVSALLREDGLMCCLGQRAIACGIEAKSILDVETPDNISESKLQGDWSKYIESSSGDTTDLADALMLTNDKPKMSLAVREKRLKKLFAEIGDEVEFVN